MKILVLGASGRTGSLFTRKALEEGHTVTAYVRNPDKAVALLGAHQNLIIVPGALNDSEQLATISSGVPAGRGFPERNSIAASA